MLVMPWLAAAPASRSPSVPLSMTAGRQLDPWPAMLRSDSRQAAPPAVPAAITVPPGRTAELRAPAGGKAEAVPEALGAARVRAAAGRAAGLPVWADTTMATAAAPAISPDAAPAQRRARMARPRCSTAPTGAGGAATASRSSCSRWLRICSSRMLTGSVLRSPVLRLSGRWLRGSAGAVMTLPAPAPHRPARRCPAAWPARVRPGCVPCPRCSRARRRPGRH